jgi:hypothetical protein
MTIESERSLKELNELLKERSNLASKGKNFWDRLRWPSKQMDGLMIRLVTQTSLPLLFCSSIAKWPLSASHCKLWTDSTSLEQNESKTKLENKVDIISREMRERHPPLTLAVKPKQLPELLDTFHDR